MKVLFISYYDFRSPSGLHIFHLANSLTGMGVECHVYCHSGSTASVYRYGKPRFHCYSSTDTSLRDITDKLGGEIVIHAWTPREPTRLLAEPLAKRLKAPVIVHMEDNEEQIFKDQSAHYLANTRKAEDADWNSNGIFFGLSHPVRSKKFMEAARGYTCIIESLLEFKPEHVPGIYFWPACEDEFFTIPQESTDAAKIQYGLPPGIPTVFYPGAMHDSNMQEVSELYLALAHLNARGIRINIIKYGPYALNVELYILKKKVDWIFDLTKTANPSDIPQIMQAADILIQPGKDTPFNHYRFPCKLPMFMASGRPVILPRSNLGYFLDNGRNCLLLTSGDTMEMSVSIKYLLDHPEEAKSIGLAGREFARRNFNWQHSATKLYNFYKEILESA